MRKKANPNKKSRKPAAPKVEADPTRLKFRLNGGPYDEHELWLCNPPPRWLRLAVPVWATYEWVELAEEYLYRGEAAPPSERQKEHVVKPWVPPRGPGPLAGEEYVGTPAWQRGLERFEEAKRIREEGL